MAKASKEIIQKHEQMFYPTVRVRTKKAGGSGTVVYSESYKDEVYTYIITNQHVIDDSVHVEKRWDPVLKRKVDKEILDTVYVEYFKYNNYSHTVGSFAVEADIVAYSEVDGGQDWALLRVRDKENKADWVANMFPLNDIENVHIFDDCYAVGASLGHPPVASNGMITYMDDEIDHYKYWMSSAPTIFGNSGGAVYRWSGNRKQYEYIGIPSRISIQPMGFSADAITHMGYFIPIDRVYQLLEDNDYNFIYDSSISIEDCEKARKEKQEPEKEDKED
ncbi:MAG: trypsin-like peptidase domain-containing protein [Candidatus Pelagibacter sp.]|nr:trypsin-like peptidase domain-containing protein [Candidatus Pelagibacter sp.]